MMPVSPELPSNLRAALERICHGRSRKALGVLAAAQSQNYRAGGGSHTIDTEDQALAYALTRLPATYAAASAALTHLREALPEFRPTSLTDVGAGPGTASFAAVETFSTLSEIRLFDANPYFRALASRLTQTAESAALRKASYRLGDVLTLLSEPAAAPADLVIASYVASEMPQGEITHLAKALWAATAAALLVVEPGTPAGYARIMTIRNALIPVGAPDSAHAARDTAHDGDYNEVPGIYMAAPCPHERACPLTGSDWCHFAQRLPRLRDHLQVKGVSVPFEDEKFCFVAFSRLPPTRIDARVLAPPVVTKGAITSKLCTPEGLLQDIAARRDGITYRRRKDWRWGDAVTR